MSDFSARLKTFPVLETPRLTLRSVQEADAVPYFEQLSALPPTSAWSDSYEAQSRENCQRAIKTYGNNFEKTKTVIPWALVDRRGGLVGFLKISDIQNRSKGELAYWLGQAHWGQGLVAEAADRAVRFAFTELGMHRIYATIHPNNTASRRVLEKVGFQQEGILRQNGRLAGEWADSILFGLLRSDLAL